MSAGDILIRSASMQRLAKGSNGQVLKLSGGLPVWQAPSGNASSDLSNVRDQIEYLMFKKDASITYQQINGMVFDSFTDANGIDTANCANIARNASNYYAPNSISTNAWVVNLNSWSNELGNMSVRTILSSANITANGASIKITLPGANVTGNVAHFSIVERDGNTPNGTTTPTEILFNGVSGATIPANGVISSDWTTYSLDKTKSYLLIADFTGGRCKLLSPGGDTGYYYLANTASYNTQNMPTVLRPDGTGFANLLEVSSGVGSNSNATLISNPFTSITQPTSARISLFVNPVDALTLNTDLMAYASSNNGTTWNQITLSSVANLPASIKQYTGTASLTGANTSMRLKVVSANNKNFQITAWGLAWY